jgi:hypothetical protein
MFKKLGISKENKDLKRQLTSIIESYEQQEKLLGNIKGL